MVSFPPCKINIGLYIKNKRADGFHEIETCFYPVTLTDILEIIPSRDFTFTQSGLYVPGEAGENLCVKAYRKLQTAHALPTVSMHLHKTVPMGAGLGGGSSDAAHAIRIIDEMFGLKLTPAAKARYASELGSDCAFFLDDRPKMGRGRGELLSDVRVDLSGKYLVIVKPDVHISTAEAYRSVNPGVPTADLATALETLHPDQWRDHIINDFEKAVFPKFPVIGEIKSALYDRGALYASMSGSGSAVYGIFSKEVSFPQKENTFVWSGWLK